MTGAMVGLRIREKRRAAGMRQAELAERMGISASYLNLIEREKRRAAPDIVARAAKALGVGAAELDGALERRMADRLAEIAQDPDYADLSLDPDAARELLGRHPGWGRALVRAHDARREASRLVEALSDRLTHDPVLSDAVHRMLTHIAALRSTSEILEDVEDIDASQRRRFHEILLTESTRLSEVSENLLRFFDEAHQAEPTTPTEDVEDAFLAAGNHFPGLEPPEPENGAAAHPEAIYGALRAALPGGGAAVASPEAPPVLRRRALALAVARRTFPAAIETEISARPRLTAPAARVRAEAAFLEYCIDALLMPSAPFEAAGRRLAWDLDALAASFGVDFDAAARRVTALSARGVAPRAAYARINAAGQVLQRRLLPEITLPRHGAACPLWSLYRALSATGRTLRQLAEFPSGERAVFVARADPADPPIWGRPAQHRASVLVLPGDPAATVYAPRPREPAESVGPNCRVCARTDCAHRAEDPVIG